MRLCLSFPYESPPLQGFLWSGVQHLADRLFCMPMNRVPRDPQFHFLCCCENGNGTIAHPTYLMCAHIFGQTISQAVHSIRAHMSKPEWSMVFFRSRCGYVRRKIDTAHIAKVTAQHAIVCDPIDIRCGLYQTV